MYTEEKKEVDLNEETFNNFKEEILERAKAKNACKYQYVIACETSTIKDLCDVIKDNFHWCCHNAIFSPQIIEKYRELFADNDIFFNCDCQQGFLQVCGDAKVDVCNNVRVYAYDNAMITARHDADVFAIDNVTVNAMDNAKVLAYDNAIISVSDYARVRCLDNVKVTALNDARVESFGESIIWAYDCSNIFANGNTVVNAFGTVDSFVKNVTVCAFEKALVIAYHKTVVCANGVDVRVIALENAIVTSHSVIDCKLGGNAIHRILDKNKIIYASDEIAFEKSSEYIPDESNNK